jgi:hypothetical protein
MREHQSGAVSDYRCYLLDKEGSIRRAHELHCVDDDEAKQRAIAWLKLPENTNGAGVEVWQMSRRVRRSRRWPSSKRT